MPRFEAQQRHDGLRADILDAPAACVSLWFLERRARDARGSLAAVAAFPAGEQPFGTGELNFAGGPRNGLARDLAQDGVDEPHGRRLPRTLYQFHALSHGRMRRNALEMPKLIDPHPQCRAHFAVELLAASRIMFD